MSAGMICWIAAALGTAALLLTKNQAEDRIPFAVNGFKGWQARLKTDGPKLRAKRETEAGR